MSTYTEDVLECPRCEDTHLDLEFVRMKEQLPEGKILLGIAVCPSTDQQIDHREFPH